MSEWLKVGKIVNTHGIRGEVRVISTTDSPELRYKIGNVLYIEHPEQPKPLEVTVAAHRRHKTFDLLMFDGYENVNQVEPFKGGVLKTAIDENEELGEHEFYYHEIIGCQVITEEGEELGRVKEILSPGANDVWVVKRNGKKDLLLPYIEQVVKKVDLDEQLITVHLMEGLE